MPRSLRSLPILLVALLCAGCATRPPRPRPATVASAAQPATEGGPPRVIARHGRFAVAPVQSAQALRAAFVASLLHDHPELDRAHILELLGDARVQPSILAAMERPAEARPWKDYRPIFLGRKRIDAGVAFYRRHRALIDGIAGRYGVPPSVLVAILGVETYYGRQTGGYRVLDALYTLAFHYPPRAAFFQKELAVFLSLPRSLLPGPRASLRGSYAGAMGWCQFMPSSFAAYAVSASGSGPADLWNSLPDILASTAHYLAANGWQRGGPIARRAHVFARHEMPFLEHSAPIHNLAGLAARGFTLPGRKWPAATPATLLQVQGRQGPEYWVTFTNFQVITRYNSSPLYALAVTQLADAIRRGVAPGGPRR